MNQLYEKPSKTQKKKQEVAQAPGQAAEGSPELLESET